jgi:hypothetical protein
MKISILFMFLFSLSLFSYEYGEGGHYPFLANLETLDSVYEPVNGTYVRYIGRESSDSSDFDIVSIEVVVIETGNVILREDIRSDDWEIWVSENNYLFNSVISGELNWSVEEINNISNFCHNVNNYLNENTQADQQQILIQSGEFWSGEGNPHDILLNNQSFWRDHGLDSFNCRTRMRVFSENLLSESSWGGTDAPSRARHIHAMSRNILNEVRTLADATGENSPTTNLNRDGNYYQSYINSKYIDPLIDANTMTCIALYETRHEALFNPFSLNYTYCGDRGSTAFGLGQITRSTINGMVNNSAGNLMPFLRPESADLRNETNGRNIQRRMSVDPNLQIESMIYIMNEKIKFVRRENRNRELSDEDIITGMIISYDQDGQSSYIRRVNNCRACLGSSNDPWNCYVEHLHSDENLFTTLPWQ